MSGKGYAVIDFGAWPGGNEASVDVIEQTDILAESYSEAWFSGTPTSDHTTTDHAFAGSISSVVTSNTIAGVGFTITVYSTEKLQGTFNVNWVWA